MFRMALLVSNRINNLTQFRHIPIDNRFSREILRIGSIYRITMSLLQTDSI